MNRKKKVKKNKNIQITREEWLVMQNKEVICNHSKIDYFLGCCRICNKSLIEIDKEREKKKNAMP